MDVSGAALEVQSDQSPRASDAAPPRDELARVDRSEGRPRRELSGVLVPVPVFPSSTRCLGLENFTCRG